MGKEKIAVGMSGGVDSSVAAYILKEKGYHVIGITMKVVPEYVKCGSERTEEIVKDAKKVAEILDIEHHVIDLRDEFQKEVIDNFNSEYMIGRTPNPCIICNNKIKFGVLLDVAKNLGAEKLVTGHYAKIEYDEELDRYLLKKGEDSSKDQSYFLYRIKKENLKDIIMPLRDWSKDEIREVAKKISLDIAEKKDSEEICFIPDDNHSQFIKDSLGEEIEKGDFIDINGNVLGEHQGIINYTIGQRKGLGIALGQRVYVQEIIPETNQVVLGTEEGIFKNKLYAEDLNWISIDELLEEMKVKAKVRYRAQESKATIKPYKNGVLVEFDKDQRAITKGQSVVFYDGDIVIGGGIIKEIY